MRRREFIKLIVGSAAAWPPLARAQQPIRLRRIGVLLFAAQERAAIDPFLSRLEALGYSDGKTVIIEYRDAAGNDQRAPELAKELVLLNPDVIFSFGGDLAPSIKMATTTIPIVVVVSNDPVESGLVASLARPGGNITGITQVHDMLAGKSIELLKDMVPLVSRVAILWNPNHADPEFRETQRASRALGVQLQSLEVREPDDYDGAFLLAMRERAEALIVIGSRLQFQNRHRVGDFAEKNRLIMVGVPAWVGEIGGLFNYGPNVPDLLRRAATYVDKILKGAKPSDLPMEQPTAFELNINLRAAKRLGITVPQTVIARADTVIE
jgi:putative tryptophan/tyrosine transport system substrate-binding protein